MDKRIQKDSFDIFAYLCREKKSYKEKIDFLVSHLNQLDQIKYKQLVENPLIREFEYMRNEVLIRTIINERFSEDLARQTLSNEAAYYPYSANEHYSLINYVIESDEIFSKKPAYDTKFHKVSIDYMLSIGISYN